jgi:hypothetical protein
LGSRCGSAVKWWKCENNWNGEAPGSLPTWGNLLKMLQKLPKVTKMSKTLQKLPKSYKNYQNVTKITKRWALLRKSFTEVFLKIT